MEILRSGLIAGIISFSLQAKNYNLKLEDGNNF